MTDRKKLVGLLDVIIQPGQKTLGEIADYLLANGVTFAENATFRLNNAEPNPARWIVYGNWRECSHCHEASMLSVKEHKSYCPACGAHMIEEVETDG